MMGSECYKLMSRSVPCHILDMVVHPVGFTQDPDKYIPGEGSCVWRERDRVFI